MLDVVVRTQRVATTMKDVGGDAACVYLSKRVGVEGSSD